jgi:hypothetical protein
MEVCEERIVLGLKWKVSSTTEGNKAIWNTPEGGLFNDKISN